MTNERLYKRRGQADAVKYRKMKKRSKHDEDGRSKEQPVIRAINCVFNSLQSHILEDSTDGKVPSKLFLIILIVKLGLQSVAEDHEPQPS